MVTNSYGRPLPGVKIAITGSQNVTVSTRASGGYSVVEPPGTYTVTAQPANGMFAPQASPACVVRGGACVLTGANGSVQVNFVTQHLPVVLVTGLNEAQAGMTPGRQCTPTATGVMQTLCTVLQAAGFPAYVPSAGRYAVSGDVLTNTLNVDPNASSLMTYLAHTVGGPALLVGHSMGGLFARDAIGRYGAQAAGLFAIGTPFDGSFGADLDMAATVLPSCPYVCAGLRAVGTVLMAYLGKAAVRDLTYLARALDNRTLPPIGIPAWTFAGTACEGPSFLGPYWSPNDGAVGESSAFGVDTLGRGPKQLAGADYHSANVKYAAPLCGAHLNETDDPAIADEVLDAARQLDAPGPARDTPKRARVATSRVRTAPIGHRPIVIHLQQLAGRDIAARATIPMGPGTSVVAGRSFALDCDGRVVQALPGMGGKIFGFPTGALSCQRAALADTKGLRAVIGSDPADVIATLRHQSGPTFTLTLTAARRLSGITLRRGRRRLRVAMHRRGARRIVIRLRATKGAPVTITAAVGGSSYSAILGALG
jgi:pimeloyl-ACP methyl ester carboxylesterase